MGSAYELTNFLVASSRMSAVVEVSCLSPIEVVKSLTMMSLEDQHRPQPHGSLSAASDIDA